MHKHFHDEIRKYNSALGFASFCDHINAYELIMEVRW